MEALPRGSKQWWCLAKQLLRKKGSSRMFPPLKDASGSRCKEPGSKANAFASCWKAKNRLPDEVFEMPFFPTEPQMASFNVIRVRSTCRELAKIRTDQASYLA